MIKVNAEKIAAYKEQLRDQTLDMIEAVGIQNAIDMTQIRISLMEDFQAKLSLKLHWSMDLSEEVTFLMQCTKLTSMMHPQSRVYPE